MTPRARAMMQAHADELPQSRIRITRKGEADCLVRARVIGFDDAEITSGVTEGKRKMIVFAPDVTWPDPLREGDRVLGDDLDLYVNTVDDQKRRVDGTLIAYEITASGL